MHTGYISPAVITFAMGAYLFWESMERMRKQESMVIKMGKYNKMIRSWPVLDARITRLGIDCELPNYREDLPDPDDFESWEAYEKAEKTFDKELKRSISENNIYGGVLIEYVYFIDGIEHRSRTVSPVFEEKHRELVYRYSVGDEVKVWVNPDKPKVSYLAQNTKAGLAAFRKKRLWESTGKMASGTVLLVAGMAMLAYVLI